MRRAVILVVLVVGVGVGTGSRVRSTEGAPAPVVPLAERDADLAAQHAADPVLVARTYIAAPYADVWRAFATADGYAPWYSSPCREFADAPGGACVWGSEERVSYRGTLLRLEPGAGLTHTFRFEGFGFDEPATRVDIEIAQAGEVVRVVVRHDCSGAPETWGMITPVGWVKALARLKTLLETGEVMAWPG